MSILAKKKQGRGTGPAAVVLCLAGAAAAQEMPREGCYARTYDAAHLSARPNQVVASMLMRVTVEDDLRFAAMAVTFADQGHAGRDGFGGRTLRQWVDCRKDSQGRPFCGVECDGGWFTVTRQDAAGLTLRTEHLMIGNTEGCGGAVDLAEVPGQAVSYRLNRVGDADCEGM